MICKNFIPALSPTVFQSIPLIQDIEHYVKVAVSLILTWVPAPVKGSIAFFLNHLVFPLYWALYLLSQVWWLFTSTACLTFCFFKVTFIAYSYQFYLDAQYRCGVLNLRTLLIPRLYNVELCFLVRALASSSLGVLVIDYHLRDPPS